MKATLISFGFRSGTGGAKADAWIDTRTIRNPWFSPQLRELNGLNLQVQGFVASDPQFPAVRRAVRAALKDGVRLGIGCFGGKHRSVAVVELMAKELRAEGWQVEVVHRELAEAVCN